LLEAVDRELHRSPDLRDVPGIKERITARFERIEAGIGRKMTGAAEFSRPLEAARRSWACSAPSGHHE
jgi:hypothetical protein